MTPVPAEQDDYVQRVLGSIQPPEIPIRRPTFLQGLGQAIFPDAAGVDPAVSEAARNQAILQFGLGTLAAAQQPGARFGSALFQGLGQASQSYQGAVQSTYTNSLKKAELEQRQKAAERDEKTQARLDKEAARLEKKAAREDSETSATTATRLATGIKNAVDPVRYLGIVGTQPEVRATLTQYGIDPATLTTPEAVRAVGSQLEQGGYLGLPADIVARQDLEQQQQQFTAEQNRLNRDAQITSSGARTAAQEERERQRQIANLRKEFRRLQTVKDYETVLPLIESARNAPDTRQGDLALIYTLGKVFDPGSVVREGELKLTAEAAPFLQQLVGRIRGELGKGRLTPQTRSEMIDALEQRVSGYKQAYTRDYDTYAQYGQQTGVDPNEIVGKRPETAYGKPSAGRPALSDIFAE